MPNRKLLKEEILFSLGILRPRPHSRWKHCRGPTASSVLGADRALWLPGTTPVARLPCSSSFTPTQAQGFCVCCAPPGNRHSLCGYRLRPLVLHEPMPGSPLPGPWYCSSSSTPRFPGETHTRVLQETPIRMPIQYHPKAHQQDDG